MIGDKKSFEEGGIYCKVEGCPKVIFWQGVCKWHYGSKKADKEIAMLKELHKRAAAAEQSERKAPKLPANLRRSGMPEISDRDFENDFKGSIGAAKGSIDGEAGRLKKLRSLQNRRHYEKRKRAKKLRSPVRKGS
jgi:hypothetical protein